MDGNHFGKAYRDGLQRTINFLMSRGVPSIRLPTLRSQRGYVAEERLGQLRDESIILAWINTIALNHFRRSLRSRCQEESLTPEHDGSSTGLNVAAIDLKRIMGACSPKDRALLEAQLVGSTPKELAQREGVSQTAIRIRLLRARRSARRLCEPAMPLARAS